MDIESRQRRSPMLLTRIATFVAVGVVAGLALTAVPNVELVTAVCFMSGYLLGPAAGVVTGGLTEALFAGFNPMGSSVGLLLAAQVLGMALAGLAGALASVLITPGSRVVYAAILGVFAVVVTLIFDLLTNLAFPIMAGFSFSGYAATLMAGLPFAVVHVVSNVFVFVVIVAPVLPRLQKALKVP